jgi:hypothetical protein
MSKWTTIEELNKWRKIEEIAIDTRDSFKMPVIEIACGYCASFAKLMFDALKESGIESDIVVNKVFALDDELEGYQTIESDYCEGEYSHCYIKVDGWFFDSFDVEGVETEDQMNYLTELDNY